MILGNEDIGLIIPSGGFSSAGGLAWSPAEAEHWFRPSDGIRK
jgi:hypothetical protein